MSNDENENEWTTVVTKKKQPSKNENAPVNPNAIQDWDKVIIHGKSAPSSTIKKSIAPGMVAAIVAAIYIKYKDRFISNEKLMPGNYFD